MNKPRRQRVLLVTRNSGTGFWRVIQPLRFLNEHGICDVCWVRPDQMPTRDRAWLDSWDTIVLHQNWQDEFVPLIHYWRSIGRRIVLSCDDLIVGHQIPAWNKGGVPYNDPTIMRNVHDEMMIADKVIVTQPFLLKGLSKFYEVPESRFLVFPNLPSVRWIGGLFNPTARAQSFANRKKLRIGVLSSLSHYQLDDNSKQEDDLEIVLEAMERLNKRGLKGKCVWVFFTNENARIKERIGDLAEVEFKNMTPIVDYPRSVASSDIHLCVAPLQDNDFNNSKSDIKVTECAALGIPIVASRAYAYNATLQPNQLVDGGLVLGDRIEAIMGWSRGRFQKEIQDSYNNTFESDVDYFGQRINGYWLERNLEIVGDAFLKFTPDTNADGIVPPPINMKEQS